MADKAQSKERKARTAAALRENLRKRKAAARKAKAVEPEPKKPAGEDM